ncbi:hypothetical protein [Noviherbaspirillum galbum]|uniref:Lipoprotein n=1 Tax=Noviherbaspirillum galbum TaxID=2709383 RepID=A0A6B3SNC0_9BURK|nr:hypothetical protein [Noviherbaspirillum galbum]NEX61958.1 hypothetical protein [Noviherbaspirillum galbum]
MKLPIKALAAALILLPLLEGCAVYGPPPAYSQGPYYSAPVYANSGPAYSQAPVYVQPAPAYVGPPVYFGLDFGFWGGGRRGWGGRHWH